MISVEFHIYETLVIGDGNAPAVSTTIRPRNAPMDLEERYREWLKRAEQIDKEGLLGEEIKTLTPGNKRAVPTLSGAEFRTDFPTRGGASARIDETMHKLGSSAPPRERTSTRSRRASNGSRSRESVSRRPGQGATQGRQMEPWEAGADTAGPGLEAPVTAAAVSAETTLI